MRKNVCIFILMFLLSITPVYSQEKMNIDFIATYFGGSDGEHNDYIAVDDSGYVFLVGHTYSTDLPVKNAYQSVPQGEIDAFIVRFKPDLSDITFSTYLGGSSYDEIKEIAIDNIGDIYVTGLTYSEDFPVTDSAYDDSFNGGEYDGFFAKISSAGELLYSTYIGGSGKDFGMSISVDESMRVYIAGNTESNDFPVKSALIDTNSGNGDIFLLKFDMENDSLLFSSYIGGGNKDYIRKISFDDTYNIHIGGNTQSSDFPIINGFDTTYHGNQDGFIMKINRDCNAIIYSSFIGGNGTDDIYDLCINNNEAFFIGNTQSTDLTCSENAFSTNKKGGYDLLIGKINSLGDSLLYLSYFGGDNVDGDPSIKAYPSYDETIIITGSTESTDFPVSDNAYDSTVTNSDFFFSVLDINNKEILYSSYFGGSNIEWASELFFVNDSIVYFCGSSNSIDFPNTENTYMENLKGDRDEILMRFTLRSVAAIEEPEYNVPDKLQLNQNHPNPFNNITTIGYQIPMDSDVKLSVYNLAGQEIKSLVNEYQSAGEYQITWNAEGLPGGIYICQLTANEHTFQKKMILM